MDARLCMHIAGIPIVEAEIGISTSSNAEIKRASSEGSINTLVVPPLRAA